MHKKYLVQSKCLINISYNSLQTNSDELNIKFLL